MNPFAVVKNLILISVCCISLQLKAQIVRMIPQFECGRYRVQGKLILNQENYFILSVRNGTSSPFELILFGGDFDSKLKSVGSLISTQIYVPRKIASQVLPVAYLISVGPYQQENPWVSKTKDEKCGLRLKSL